MQDCSMHENMGKPDRSADMSGSPVKYIQENECEVDTTTAVSMTEDHSQAEVPLLAGNKDCSVGQPPGISIPLNSSSPSASGATMDTCCTPSSSSSSPATGLFMTNMGGSSEPSTTACQFESGLLGSYGPAATEGFAGDTKSDTNSATLHICRICHCPEEERNLLITPCRCSGTLEFIHQSCLMKWLEVSSRKSRKPPKCELCHYQYHRHKKIRLTHWRFPRVTSQDKIMHIIFIINLVVMIGCAVATIMCFLSDKGQITRFPRNKANLTSEEITTLSCGVLFFVSFFIAMAVQIKAKHTVYQLLVKCIMTNLEWQIDEYDKTKDSLYKGPPVPI